MEAKETKRREAERQVIVELPKSLVKALKVAAIERDSSMKGIVEIALRQYLRVESRV